MVRRLKDPELRKHSIGVIAFSVSQQNLIDDVITDTIEADSQLQEYANEMYEPIFVKNLENVQGDERDVILFSIGYGPDRDGNVSMNFGPLNNSGGERRLNVAVSRARQEMMVFSTLKSEQIDLRRTKSKGVEGLKHFLEYAEQQILTKTEIGENEDSVIATQIAAALEDKGYTTNVGVGRSQFKVDVAIAAKDNPDVYTLGILLDGEGYHRTQTTRDREIVQPSVLGSLKWQVMRVWSVDWLNNPERVISRIVEKMKEEPVEKVDREPQEFDISKEQVVEKPTNAEAYTECSFPMDTACNMYDTNLCSEILLKEQPMTLLGLCHRICALRGISRVTPKMQNTFKGIVSRHFYITRRLDYETIWLKPESAEGYIKYRPNSSRDINDIPIDEIENVIYEVAQEQLAIGADALILLAAKKMGFARRGNNVAKLFNDALNLLTQL